MASLGDDLASIRKERQFSLEDIREATKIPQSIISSIEDDSIFTRLEDNPTYIRSYVRSYGKVIAIEENEIIRALDKQAKGNYSGSLQKFLDNPDEKKIEDQDEIPDDTADQNDRKLKKPEKKNGMVHDHSPEFLADDDKVDKKEKSKEKESSPHEAPPVEVPDVKSIDWVGIGRRFQKPLHGRPKVWIGLIFILLIAVIAGIFYLYYGGGLPTSINESADVSESSVSTDSLQLNVGPPVEDTSNLAVQPSDIPNEGVNTLPDTLHMTVYAAYGKLEPVRIYTDIINAITPYWIEQGEAIRFNFVNEFRMRGDLNSIVLLMNGHAIENARDQFYNPDTRLMEINRSFFEDDPKWLQPVPDSLNIEAPAPSIIRERPTFNDS